MELAEPVVPLAVTRRFRELTDDWRSAVAMISSMSFLYQEIISLGPVAVPLMLESLVDDPDWWFYALSSATGEYPALNTKTFRAARAAWLAWGTERGIINPTP